MSPVSANLSPSVVDLVLSAGVVPKTVLIVLLCASVASWAIIGYKTTVFLKAEASNHRFLAFFSKTERLEEVQKEVLKPDAGPMTMMVRSLFEKLDRVVELKNGLSCPEDRPIDIKSLERVIQSGIQDEIAHIERYLHFLATVGNTAPFVGLFGTVWGIMDAFQEIGLQGTPNIAVVAPGMAEALIATAAGLLVAIPAVVAYNIFVNKLRKMEVQLQVFAAEIIGLIEERIPHPAVLNLS